MAFPTASRLLNDAQHDRRKRCMTAIATTPTAATPAALQPHYDPLAGDDRRTNQEWLRRNAATFSWGNGDHAEAQEIDPRYRERSYSFRDILESVNPIQHLPI